MREAEEGFEPSTCCFSRRPVDPERSICLVWSDSLRLKRLASTLGYPESLSPGQVLHLHWGPIFSLSFSLNF